MDKHIWKAVNKMGKENWNLPWHAIFRMRMDNTQSSRIFRISS